MAGTERTPQVRGAARREEIMQAALDAFLDRGYLGTSVDEIAAAARASKRTVYSHFGDKEALFREVIRSTIAPMQEALQRELDTASRDDPRESIRSIARSLATIILAPQVVRLRRVVIAETDRFPDLAAEWYRLGPGQTVERLAAYLGDLDGLSIPDLRVAAEQLLWLVVSEPLNRLMFAPSGTTVSPAEIERTASHAFDAFWRAYGPDNDRKRRA
ncbi:MAG: TetR/AcrR family transcriptional regulator [Micromonosporaceae bacterium]|nr:TetR/AcrR family transcriptional regulator [Micromonosporaceae bacterium]